MRYARRYVARLRPSLRSRRTPYRLTTSGYFVPGGQLRSWAALPHDTYIHIGNRKRQSSGGYSPDLLMALQFYGLFGPFGRPRASLSQNSRRRPHGRDWRRGYPAGISAILHEQAHGVQPALSGGTYAVRVWPCSSRATDGPENGHWAIGLWCAVLFRGYSVLSRFPPRCSPVDHQNTTGNSPRIDDRSWSGINVSLHPKTP